MTKGGREQERIEESGEGRRPGYRIGILANLLRPQGRHFAAIPGASLFAPMADGPCLLAQGLSRAGCRLPAAERHHYGRGSIHGAVSSRTWCSMRGRRATSTAHTRLYGDVSQSPRGIRYGHPQR